MRLNVAVIAPVIFAASLGFTEGYRRIALRRGILDRPNERSSHSAPTPRGGGIAIVLASLGGFFWLWKTGALDTATTFALSTSLAIAMIGFADDRFSVPARLRLVIHTAAATAVILMLNASTTTFSSSSVAGAVILLVLIFGTVWSVNLFNFMDGIDGIAAAEAVFVTAAGASLGALSGAAQENIDSSIVFAAAVAGFLIWNLPPAKIFMGDVGSGFLGFIVAVLALLAAAHRRSDFYVWLILSAGFVADSTVTLVTRFFLGNAVSVAHRTHTYQRLALRWRSHGRVTLGFLIVNVVWLLPLAAFATFKPNFGLALAFISFAPLVAIAVVNGAGRPLRVSN